MIPSDDILVNIVVLVNIAPTAKLVKSITFKMHLSMGGLEGIVEGESDCTGFVDGEVVGVPVASGLALGLDVVGKLFGLAVGLAVGDLVGVPVASGLALGVDVEGKLFGLAVGLALGEVVGSAVSPQSLNDILPMVICCVK